MTSPTAPNDQSLDAHDWAHVFAVLYTWQGDRYQQGQYPVQVVAQQVAGTARCQGWNAWVEQIR